MGQRIILAALFLVLVSGCGSSSDGNGLIAEDISPSESEFNSNLNGVIYYDTKESYVRIDLPTGRIESFLSSERQMTSSSLNAQRFVTIKRSAFTPEILGTG